MSEAPGPLFDGLRFAHAVSLGANCEPAHQLRRLGRHSLHGLFDWLVTPLASLEAILEDDGARLGQSFVAAHDGRSVRCGAYGVLYHHEFPRDAPGEAVRFDAGAIAACRRKMLHKVQTLLGACTGMEPLLFIRAGPESELAWDAAPTPGDADVRALEQAIARRFPALDFRLLVVDTAPERRFAQPPPGDRLEVVHAPRRRARGWALDDGDWDAIFARLRFAIPADVGRPLGETLHLSGEGDDPSEPPRLSGRSPGFAADLEEALELWRGGRGGEAEAQLVSLYERGCRHEVFLDAYAALLTGKGLYADVLGLHAQRLQARSATTPRLDFYAAHAKLALAHDRPKALSAAVAREAAAGWLGATALMQALETACRMRRPFSFVRIGDGEARFALAAGLADAKGLKPRETAMMGEVMWRNWFNAYFADVDAKDLRRLSHAYREAVAHADVLGVADACRLASDNGHYGYLAAQEAWLRDEMGAPRRRQRLTSALNHYALDAASPHLRALLQGQPFVGVISPHPDLGRRLAAALSIPHHADHVVPAESRLADDGIAQAAPPHFPDRYLDLLRELRVPFRGAVFLVAAGLLGKVYCQRIKALGGVALDIGSLADGWMGFDTRPGQTSAIPPLPELAGEAQPPLVVACVSMAKTGSNALTVALRDAGWRGAVHTHYVGPLSVALKARSFAQAGVAPEPMMGASQALLAQIAGAQGGLRIATSVRDPIERLIAQYFAHTYADKPADAIDLQRAEEGLLAWFESGFGRELTTEWLDDNLGQGLGVDFRDLPFDTVRLSARYDGPRGRLLILRQEDATPPKELELGWLMDRERVALPRVNTARAKPYADAYGRFKAGFRAPPSWIDEFYESDFARHFYDVQERAAFRRRWSSPDGA